MDLFDITRWKIAHGETQGWRDSLLVGDENPHLVGPSIALLDAYEAGEGAAIPLLWWTKPYPGNYGDWLSPYLFARISGRPMALRPFNEPVAGRPEIVGLGSIAKLAGDLSVVVGAGTSALTSRLNPRARYVSVRGPYTAALLRKQGGPAVERFGDPALALPLIYPATRPARTNGRIALVRHHAHRSLPVTPGPQTDEVSVMRATAGELTGLIDALLGYDAVITSAMHVYITCQLYGVPVALVTFDGAERAVAGDGIKYRDYAAGAGVPEVRPFVVGEVLPDHLPFSDARVAQDRMEDAAAAIRDAVTLYDELCSEVALPRTG